MNRTPVGRKRERKSRGVEGGKVSRWLGTISTRRECLASLFFFFLKLCWLPLFSNTHFHSPYFSADFWLFSFPINSLKLEILLLIIVYMEPFLHGHRHVSLRCCSGTQWSLLSHLAAIAGFWDPSIHILYFWIDVINRPHQNIRCIRRDKSVLNLSHATR